MYNLLLDCLIVVWLLLYYCWSCWIVRFLFAVGFLLDYCWIFVGLLLDFCWIIVGLLLDYCWFVVVTCSWYPPTMVMLASTTVMPSLLAALHRYNPPSDNWTARILGDKNQQNQWAGSYPLNLFEYSSKVDYFYNYLQPFHTLTMI